MVSWQASGSIGIDAQVSVDLPFRPDSTGRNRSVAG